MDHNGHHIAIHKETVRPLANPHVPELSAIQEFPYRIEVVDHDICVLAAAALATQRIDCYPCRDCLEDNLQVAQDLPHVVLESLDKLLQSAVLAASAFCNQYFLEALHHHCLVGFEELYIQAVAGQRPDLLCSSVVTDANDGYFAVLDKIDDRSNASTIACAHSIHFVHNDKRFREIPGDVKPVRPGFQEADPTFVTNIACIELSDGVVAFHC